ncbi:hypothetical protein ACLB2K_004335 [Fragaria x ananassa]
MEHCARRSKARKLLLSLAVKLRPIPATSSLCSWAAAVLPPGLLLCSSCSAAPRPPPASGLLLCVQQSTISDEQINRVKRPRSKDISTWFSKVQPSSCSSSQPSISTPITIGITEEPSSESPLFGSQRNEFDPHGNVNVIERDPGKRCSLWKYPANQREAVRKAYVALGPCQPKLKYYPLSLHGAQNHKFNFDWFEGHSWLEYSEDQDKIYCFPCFLFDKENPLHPAFTVDGMRNSKQRSVLTVHMGSIRSPHHEAMEKWHLLRNLATQIERVFVKRTAKELEHNRFRLKAAIEGVRLLANQGQAFRGHDESESSLNAGNFKQVRKSIKLKYIWNTKLNSNRFASFPVKYDSFSQRMLHA